MPGRGDPGSSAAPGRTTLGHRLPFGPPRPPAEAAPDADPLAWVDWRTLAADPGALEAWHVVVDALVAGGSPLQAIDGVVRALEAGAAGRELWSLMTTTLHAYRCGHALDEALGPGPVPM